MNLEITDAAKVKLVEIMRSIAESRPLVVCVGRATGGLRTTFGSDGSSQSTPVRPYWAVGFYEVEKVSPGEVISLSDLKFVRDEKLDGKTLDFHDGQFIVR